VADREAAEAVPWAALAVGSVADSAVASAAADVAAPVPAEVADKERIAKKPNYAHKMIMFHGLFLFFFLFTL